jgi:hypothetical protein
MIMAVTLHTTPYHANIPATIIRSINTLLVGVTGTARVGIYSTAKLASRTFRGFSPPTIATTGLHVRGTLWVAARLAGFTFLVELA